MTEQLITKPSGTISDITIVRRIMVKRAREQQPSLNYPDQDTLPGADSADE